jgi:hypothetical protein
MNKATIWGIHSWRLLPVLSLVALASAVISQNQIRSQTHEKSFNMERAVERAQKIGLALKTYRSFHPSKPVKQRKCPADAGLPMGPSILAEPGKPWSLPNGMKDLQVDVPNAYTRGMEVQYQLLYYEHEFAVAAKLPCMCDWFAKRGEDLPVYADRNAPTDDDIFKDIPYKIIIVRLSGAVDIVDYDPKHRVDLRSL